MHYPIFFLLSASLSLTFFLSFSLYKRFQQHRHNPQTIARTDDATRPDETDPVRSVLVGGLASDSAASNSDDLDSASAVPGGKRKKRKAKKKRTNGGGEIVNSGSDSGVRFDTACLYPFTSSSSAMQRKIKQQYDELVKSNESKKLTLAQVF